MDFAERAPAIFDVCAEKLGSELIFQFFDPTPISVAKKESDHAILENPIDKRVDNRAQPAFPAEAIKKTAAHEIGRVLQKGFHLVDVD
jgi:hypothetical protein